MKKRFSVLIICLVLAITGCKSFYSNEKDDPLLKLPSATLHEKGEAALAKKNYSDAIKYFEALDTQYPFSDYAEQTSLNLIYAYHKNNDNPTAVAIADRFIHVFPRAANVDYAYYMKGVANSNQDRGRLAKYVAVNMAWRDPGTTKDAYDDFNTLIKRFPESHYAADARQRMVYLRNQFALHELNVAEFYFRQKAYVAAANRAGYLVTHYPQAPQTELALVLMVKADRKLQLAEPAANALQVLKTNFPHSKYLAELGSA